MSRLINSRVLGWISLFLGVVGFTLPWANYAIAEDSSVRYHMWNGWSSLGELFNPFVSPIAPLIAVIVLFPFIGAIIAIALPQTSKIWQWALVSGFALLSLCYHIVLTLDLAQGGGQQRPAPTTYGPGLYLVALGVMCLSASLWPWRAEQPKLLAEQQ